MQSNPIQISHLCDVPRYLESVITQNHESWGEVTGFTRSEMAEIFQAEFPGDSLPVTFVAHQEEAYAGCVSLRQTTLGGIRHPEVYGEGSPWLSNMWVADWARGRGVATQLTTALEAFARASGVARIYSSTAEEDSLYHKMGYTTVKRTPFGEFTLFLIEKDL